MTFELSPYLKENFPEGFLDALFNLDEGLGFELFHQVLNKKGMHIGIFGDSRSGKTEKGKWMDLNFSRMGETLIVLDTGKEGDIECYFWNDNPRARFNKPVTVLVPYEGQCKFEVRGVPPEIPVHVLSVPAPELYLEFIRPGEINIISLRNYFRDVRKLKQYMKRIFFNFSLDARLGKFRKWTPATLKIDEAHEAAGGSSVSDDTDSILLTSELSTMERQLASAGIRMEVITQLFKDIPPGMRRNTHIILMGRGVHATKEENRAIHYLEGFASRARQDQGWMIIHGRWFYSYGPIPFPLIGTPKGIEIEYSGFADVPVEDDDRELVFDAGWRCGSFVHDAEEYRPPSLAELPPAVHEPDDEIPFFDVWKEEEEKGGVKQL
jgi:hypothetical protein